ncbi:T9SS type A sorting domain-containing protein [Mesonia ostreae]|uniref:T9SS type A sorting domain-containing protein n=1 Tax=Mesonia ostreae TaxID=861110 RepID=A0ABU2KMI6_9FLAO|nr:T9SS type A sorting domain-containing protein [Mesonia ostreae]MDT0295887.1 T9SS type A sorting domain-containing protein [Mesonia ostreae]
MISNLWINLPQDDFVGLFGQCTNSSFANIVVENANIIALGTVDTLVGNLSTNSTIDNCHVSNVTVTGTDFNCGGLVGGILTDSSISKSSSKGDVTGQSQVGGIVGTAWDFTTITECYSEGTVNGEYLIGGLVGYCTYAFVPNRTNTIVNSYSRATVTANLGRAGGVYGGADGACEISNTYSTGAVTGPEFVGGFMGAFGGGSVIISNSFYDLDTSGKDEAVGGFTAGEASYEIEGRNTADMKIEELVNLLNSGADEDVWSMDPSVNDGYPVLDNLLAVDAVQAETHSLTVYPSVFESQINVSTHLNLQSYSLYNTSGKLVSKGSLRNTSSIQTAAIASGLYILKINTQNGAVTKKVIKK